MRCDFRSMPPHTLIWAPNVCRQIKSLIVLALDMSQFDLIYILYLRIC